MSVNISRICHTIRVTPEERRAAQSLEKTLTGPVQSCVLPGTITMTKGTTVGSGTKWRGSSSQKEDAVQEGRAQGRETKTTDVSPPTPTLST